MMRKCNLLMRDITDGGFQSLSSDHNLDGVIIIVIMMMTTMIMIMEFTAMMMIMSECLVI